MISGLGSPAWPVARRALQPQPHEHLHARELVDTRGVPQPVHMARSRVTPSSCLLTAKLLETSQDPHPKKKKKVLSPWAGRPCPTGPGQSWSPQSALHQINQQSSVCTSAEVVLALLVHSQQRVLPMPSAPALIRLRTPCLLQNFLLNQPGRKMEF